MKSGFCNFSTFGLLLLFYCVWKKRKWNFFTESSVALELTLHNFKIMFHLRSVKQWNFFFSFVTLFALWDFSEHNVFALSNARFRFTAKEKANEVRVFNVLVLQRLLKRSSLVSRMTLRRKLSKFWNRSPSRRNVTVRGEEKARTKQKKV